MGSTVDGAGLSAGGPEVVGCVLVVEGVAGGVAAGVAGAAVAADGSVAAGLSSAPFSVVTSGTRSVSGRFCSASGFFSQ